MHIFKIASQQIAGNKIELDLVLYYTVKPILNGHSKIRPKICFQDRVWLNAGQYYCILQILSTFIKLPFVI